MKKIILTVVLATFAVSAGAYHELHRTPAGVHFQTAAVTRGDIVATVVSTGTLQAVKTVEVGTQASGIIKELDADFNSLVRKGQVMAKLDAAAIQSQIEEGEATVARARADVGRLQVAFEDADRQRQRAEALFAKQLVDQSDLETARVAASQASADVKAAGAAIAQAQAAVEQDRLNLEHTVITAPINGIVIARNVDVGQTVVSNMQAQTLFEIAEDLSHMQLDATVDESDIGNVRVGDPVTFSVDAYPGNLFKGTVAQVRLNPTIDQNTVAYDTVIDVPNPDLKLRPGMTANVHVSVANRYDVLRVPGNALLFKPNEELFAALHQPVPAPVRQAHRSDGSAATTSARGLVWVLRTNQLVPVAVQTGLTDGTNVEVTGGNVRANDTVVVNVRQ